MKAAFDEVEARWFVANLVNTGAVSSGGDLRGNLGVYSTELR